MEYEDINLRVVDNGFKLCYTTIEAPKTGRTYDNTIREYKELVYKDEEAQQAIATMIGLRDKERKTDMPLGTPVAY